MEKDLQHFNQQYGNFYSFMKNILILFDTPDSFSKMDEMRTQITQSKSWYKQKVRAVQKDGNDLLRKNFVDDMKKKI